MTRIQAIKQAVDIAYNTEAREVRRSGVRSVHSRGRHVATMNQHGQCSPCPGADAYEWNGSLRQLTKLVEDILENFPECTELWIEGGFDGAENPREYMDGLYDPWVGSWDVCVWTRKQGWLFTEDGQEVQYS